MKTIRRNVFETNSSSTHSITIESTGNYIKIPDKVISLNGGQFGWGWEKYNDPITKANYFALDNLGNEYRLNMLIEVLEETGKEVILDINTDWDSPNYSYIDHGGCGTTEEIYTKEELRNFIFNEDSWLYIGDDNSCPPNKFYDSPKQKYPYTLEIYDEDYLVTKWDLKEKLSENLSDFIDLLWKVFDKIRYNGTLSEWEYDFRSWSSDEEYYEFRIPWPNNDYDTYINREEGWINLSVRKYYTDEIRLKKLTFKVVKNDIT